MSIRLTNAQLAALNSAAAREDRCLEIPASMKTGVVQKLAEKLIASGLAIEIKAKGDAAVWRHDEATGRGYALKITAAGLKAIAIEDEAAPKANVKTIVSTRDESGAIAPTTPGVVEAPVSAPVGATGPRTGSKLATVVTLLQRDGGATIEELASATQWLPHTTRAALTGLRKRGYGIGRRKANEGSSAYVIADALAAASV
jgi:Protein of unknown function (DUF3489)